MRYDSAIGVVASVMAYYWVWIEQKFRPSAVRFLAHPNHYSSPRDGLQHPGLCTRESPEHTGSSPYILIQQQALKLF